jgi:hypothetical protein
MRALAIKGLLLYVSTSAVALGGACFGSLLATIDAELFSVESLARHDAIHYRSILTSGYDYDPATRSRIAFFPVYPLAARALAWLTGIAPLSALVLTSNLLLAGSFVLMAWYLEARRQPDAKGSVATTCSAVARTMRPAARCHGHGDGDSPDYALLAFGFAPMTFFFRMPYSESCFIFFCLLSFCAMQRKWCLPLVALVVGITTACRPVGIAVFIPFVVHAWQRSKGSGQSVIRRLALLPLACWGIAGFIVFQYLRFGDPFAFVRTQQHWAQHQAYSPLDKWLALLSWEPIWSTYDSARPSCFWRSWPPQCALFNCQFMNPAFFVGTAALVALGAWRGWLCRSEILASAGLLAIPYVTKAYENAMNSQGRFAAVVFPAYLVAGEILQRLPRPVACSLLAISAFFMGAYASLFVAGYPFY